MRKSTWLAGLLEILLCFLILLVGKNPAFGADSFFVIGAPSATSDITQLKSDVATLQSQVATLQGKIFPYGLVNMYEDSRVKIVLTGESKKITDMVNHKAEVAFRLLITNKTASALYIGYENNTSSVVDEFGTGQFNIKPSGIENVNATESNGNYFSVISPNSSLTANWTSDDYWVNFYESHYLTASFGFVIFGNSGNTRFNAGFTGIHLP